MDKIVLELSKRSDAYKIVEYMIEHPRGASLEEISAGTGLSTNQIYHHSTRIKTWFTNISAKRTRELMVLSYRPLDPTVQVNAVVQGSNGSSAPTAASTKHSQPTQARITSTTEVVWATTPIIPDRKEKYAFFDPPEWYKRLISKVLTHHRNVSLAGPPGIGKSSAWEFLAAEQLIPLVNIGAESGLRARQLIGGMTDLGRFEVAEFATAVVKGWWAKIDEVNGADPDAILFLNSICAPPYSITVNGRTYPVHPEFRLCITYNPGLIGTKPMPDSLKDRFYPFKLKFPNESRLKKMLKSNGVNPDDPKAQQIIAFALAASKLREERKIRFDVTMRRLLDAWTDIQDGYNVKDALYNACVDRIDNDADAVAVQALLPA